MHPPKFSDRIHACLTRYKLSALLCNYTGSEQVNLDVYDHLSFGYLEHSRKYIIWIAKIYVLSGLLIISFEFQCIDFIWFFKVKCIEILPLSTVQTADTCKTVCLYNYKIE